jgi:TatD DNase family protein
MIIDTHCHYDMMPNPVGFINKAESQGDIIIGMTNLPSHYKMGRDHVFGYKHIRLSLGFHPQLAKTSQNELPLFDILVNSTSYIGEIGLDFSSAYSTSKDIQIRSLRHILSKISNNRHKLVSVHSRKAEKELFDLLVEYNIPNVIFHWYTGSISLIKDIVSSGYYFSINEAMTKSANGRKIISAIPKERILTESDAPYNKHCDIRNTLEYLNMTETEIHNNFRELIYRMKN